MILDRRWSALVSYEFVGQPCEVVPISDPGGPVLNLHCGSRLLTFTSYAQKMAMVSKFRKLLPFKIDSHSSDIVNSNEFRTNDLIKAPSPDNFHKWDIPKINIETIYKIGTFSFQTSFSIKTHEEIVSLQNGLQMISLFKPEAIQIHLKDKFRLMHIRLVQVAIKPFI